MLRFPLQFFPHLIPRLAPRESRRRRRRFIVRRRRRCGADKNEKKRSRRRSPTMCAVYVIYQLALINSEPDDYLSEPLLFLPLRRVVRSLPSVVALFLISTLTSNEPHASPRLASSSCLLSPPALFRPDLGHLQFCAVNHFEFDLTRCQSQWI